MTFKKLLVTLDGSKSSQIAADYGFWLAANLNASLAGQHVVDPRLVDLFIEPAFAEELGFSQSCDTADKVFFALKKIGKVILQLFGEEASGRALRADTYLDQGYIVEEILKRAENYDLLIIGHHGRGQPPAATEAAIGSVAERVAVDSPVPVLIASQPLPAIKEILVAFDGSEPACGALLLAEDLARASGSRLRAITVVPDSSALSEAHMMVEQGQSYLRHVWSDPVFEIKEGSFVPTLLKAAQAAGSLLVLGAYGFSDPNRNVLGSTTSAIVRKSAASVLIFKSKRAANLTTRQPGMQASFF